MQRKSYYFLIFFVFFSVNMAYTQVTEEIQKAYWVFNFADNVEWPKEDLIETYTIGVIDVTYAEQKALEDLCKEKVVRNKYASIKVFRRAEDITYTEILVVGTKGCEVISDILPQIKDKSTLMITDQCTNSGNLMINLLPLNVGKKRFELSKKNIHAAGLKVSDKLLVQGGSEIDLKGLYTKTEKELQAKEEQLKQYEAELNRKAEELNKQKEENSKQKEVNTKAKEENAQQSEEIKRQENQISSQKHELDKLFNELKVQQEKLQSSYNLLGVKQKEVVDKENQITKQNRELDIKQEAIKVQQKKIDEQKRTMSQQSLQISIQQYIIYIVIAFLLSLIALAFFIWRGYKIKQRINSELEKKNHEINLQKEEIKTQADQLEITNKELEKLSIVASKTHNAVIIMDPQGNFEWVNAGFTRMYGYTLQLLLHEKDENIMNVSSQDSIRNILKECVEKKKTIIYDAENSTRTGTKLWVQTTLTPILDEDHNVIRLVAIDADITKIKEAEEEIKIQNRKIILQSEELEKKNKELEKLSIVASETDNAILIMDEKGDFEWVNDAFTRMIGYSIDELKKKSTNITDYIADPKISSLVSEAIRSNKTIDYQSITTTKTGQQIWIQTTLTPVTDREGKSKKIVAIDTDISKLKEAEAEIRQQSEELMAQKEELIIQKNKIELQNKQITSSIGYAKTIQQAILPTQQDITRAFDQHFIVYRPKDIVSGDFYWMSHHPAENKVFIASVDCTGHGVPGAFMSMIGSRLLSEIVNERKIHRPSQILEELNLGVIKALKQDQSENNDGMDLCLCLIENNGPEIKLTFCGAKRPLFIIRRDRGKLITFKGDRKSIGGVRTKRSQVSFTNQTTALKKGDLLYLMTDGITDQNSEDRKRFGTDRMMELLELIHLKPMNEQKYLIEKELDSYQLEEDQRDDITVFGVKL